MFARRPSPRWGTPAQLLNPAAATDSFYTALAALPGWDTLPPGAAAAAIQSDRARDAGSAGPSGTPRRRTRRRRWSTGSGPAPTRPPRRPRRVLPGLPATGAPRRAAGPAGLPGPGGSDIGESDIAAPGPLDRSRLPADVRLPTDPVRRAAVVFALAQVGRPYVFGAKGPRAFDCSGLTQAAWAAAGVGISAGTLSQIHDGTPVVTLADAAPGDLLFSAGSLGTASRPRHVGLYAGDGLVVEAHSATTGVIVSPLAGVDGPRPSRSAASPPAAQAKAAQPVAGARWTTTGRGEPVAAGRAGRRGGRPVTAAKRRVVSPATDRDLLAVAGLVVFLAADRCDQRRAGGRRRGGRGAARRAAAAHAHRPDSDRAGSHGGWLRTAVLILNDADDPGRRLAAPWSVLAGHPLLYWAVAAVLLTATAAAVGVGGRVGVAVVRAHPARARHPRPDPPGAVRAGRAAHRGVDPPRHARARPGPRPARGGRCAAAPRPDRPDVLALHQPHRHHRAHPDAASPAPTWCTRLWPHPAGCCAPPPSPTCWSSPRWPAPAAGTPGPVLVFDTTGSVAWPAQVRWSPISGCHDIRTAYQRARTLVEAAAVNLTDADLGQRPGVPGTRDRWFWPLTCWPRRCIDRGVGVLVRWAIGKPPDTEPADLLEPFYPELAANLRTEIGLVAQTSDAVWLSVRRVIEPLLDPGVAGVVHARARRRVRRPRAHQPGRDAVPDRR